MAVFELSSGAFPNQTVCVGFDGEEGLSRLFQIDVYLSIPASDDLDLVEPLGAKASLRIQLEETDQPAEPFQIHGILAELELLRSSGGDTPQALYRARIVPQLYRLLLTEHSRIWTKRSIEEILTEVLSEHGLADGTDFELRVQGGSAEEHVSQYRESDFAFISRWMERLGWYYFFEHTGSVDKLVIASDSTAAGSARHTPVRYHPQSGADDLGREAFSDFSHERKALAGRVVVQDYDYAKPQNAIVGSADADDSNAAEYVEYGLRSFDTASAASLARVRAEEVLARRTRYRAKGNATRLVPGFTFSLAGHAQTGMDRSYLVVATKQIGWQPSRSDAWGELANAPAGGQRVYRVDVEAIEAELSFRPECVTPWPRIDGFEHGVVDGPGSSPYAQIDDQGRYNVKLKYDEGTARDGRGSTFVRMGQPHGGSTEAFHFPLRKGTEVLITFLGGDPDRPLICAVAPNAATPSLVVSGNHTQNILQTGSLNRLVMEDQQGSEWINLYSPAGGLDANLYLGCPRSEGGFGTTSQCAPPVSECGANATELGPYAVQLRTNGNLQIHGDGNVDLVAGGSVQLRAQGGEFRTWCTANWDLHVGGAAQEHYENTLTHSVQAKAKRDYHATLQTQVGAAATYQYDTTFKKKVTGQATYLFGGAHEETVGLIHREVIAAGLFEAVLGDQTTTTKAMDIVDIADTGQTQTVMGNQTITVNGAPYVETTDNVTWNVTGALAMNIGAAYNIHCDKKIEVIHGVKSSFIDGLKVDISMGIYDDYFHGGRAVINATVMYSISAISNVANANKLSLSGYSITNVGSDTVLNLLNIRTTPFDLNPKGVKRHIGFQLHIG